MHLINFHDVIRHGATRALQVKCIKCQRIDEGQTSKEHPSSSSKLQPVHG